MRRASLLLIAALAGCGTPGKYDRLRELIAERVDRVSGAVVGVYVKDLADASVFGFNADTMFHAASTMKVPVMVEYFRALEGGRLARDGSIRLENRFASIVDGTAYTLDAAEDSDSAPIGGSAIRWRCASWSSA